MFERTPGVQKNIIHYWAELQNKNVVYLTNEESKLLNIPWMVGYLATWGFKFNVEPNKISPLIVAKHPILVKMIKTNYNAHAIWRYQVAYIRRLLKLNKVFSDAIKELSVLPQDGIWGDEETHTLQEWENLDNARNIIMKTLNNNNFNEVKAFMGYSPW